jgi:hypothetical protein
MLQHGMGKDEVGIAAAAPGGDIGDDGLIVRSLRRGRELGGADVDAGDVERQALLGCPVNAGEAAAAEIDDALIPLETGGEEDLAEEPAAIDPHGFRQ